MRRNRRIFLLVCVCSLCVCGLVCARFMFCFALPDQSTVVRSDSQVFVAINDECEAAEAVAEQKIQQTMPTLSFYIIALAKCFYLR